MTAVLHPLFGTIELSAAGAFEATLIFGGTVVAIDLTLESAESPAELLRSTFHVADDLVARDEVARAAIRRELDRGEDSAGVLYLSHHVEEFSPAVLRQLFGTVDRESIDAERFLASMRLVRVGLYPEDTERSVLFDYSLGKEFTNYLLSVSFNAEGLVTAIEMES